MKKPSDAYGRIIDAFKRVGSINDTVAETGISKLTVQKVLITEGLWSSERSREILRLKNDGYSTDEIAEQLHLSVKGVQAYLPYTREPYNTTKSSDSVRSKTKRDKMKTTANNQVPQAKVSAEEVLLSTDVLDAGGHSLPATKEGDKAGKKKAPTVYKLHLELVQDEDGTPITLDAEEEELLFKYAKCKAGFCRDILVPANMTLHALHYVIQRLFGWQNSHLREFSLMPADFSALTNDVTEKWAKLCGAYFRFPDEESIDQYWDDDYEGAQSFKTWLKQKYKGPYYAYGICDTYYDNQKAVKKLFSWLDDNQKTSSVSTLSGLKNTLWLGGKYNALLERLRLSELLVPETMSRPAAEDAVAFACDSIGKIETSCTQENLRSIKGYEYFVRTKCYREQKTRTVVEDFMWCRKEYEPALIPFTHELMYQYDFGDGWCVRVTCTEGYYYNDSFDTVDGFFVVPMDEERFLAQRDYYQCADDSRVSDDLNEIMRQVEWKQLPSCIYSDGLDLIEDVGGIYGYIDFVKTIHGEDQEEAKEMLEWAKSQGWTSRLNKPEKML